jgi:hypothetical protein
MSGQQGGRIVNHSDLDRLEQNRTLSISLMS